MKINLEDNSITLGSLVLLCPVTHDVGVFQFIMYLVCLLVLCGHKLLQRIHRYVKYKIAIYMILREVDKDE